jgi:Domain of unknown function (DUF4169)
MADIVNLRLARKRKARLVEEEKAEENRHLHGRTRLEKQRERAAREREKQFLDGHRLDRDAPVGKS